MFSKLLGDASKYETFYGFTEILKLWLLPEIWLKNQFFFWRLRLSLQSKWIWVTNNARHYLVLLLFFLFLFYSNTKMSCVTELLSREESALLLHLKELHWKLYYVLKSRISNCKQLTGQLNVVKSFTRTTHSILKCFNI